MFKKYILIFACFVTISNCFGKDYLGTWQYLRNPYNSVNMYDYTAPNLYRTITDSNFEHFQYINIFSKDNFRELFIDIDTAKKVTGYEAEDKKIVFFGVPKLKFVLNTFYDIIISVKADTLSILRRENYMNLLYTFIRIPQERYDSLLSIIIPIWPKPSDKQGLVFTNTLDTAKKIVFNSKNYPISECGVFSGKRGYHV